MEEQGKIPETPQEAPPNVSPRSESSSADYANYQQPVKQSKWKKPLLIVVAIIVLGAGAFGIYTLLSKKDSPSKTIEQSTANQPVEQTSTTGQITTETKKYSSQNFSLSFSYPKDWTVTDTTGSGKMTVTSPAMNLVDPAGQSFKGQITLMFRSKTQKLTEFDAGNSTASLDSQKITYAQPSQTQRGETYLSFLRYATTANAKALDGLYITGDSGYKKDQAIPLVDLTKVDPVISVTFSKCADSACAKPAAASISASVWSDKAFSDPILGMLKSITIN